MVRWFFSLFWCEWGKQYFSTRRKLVPFPYCALKLGIAWIAKCNAQPTFTLNTCTSQSDVLPHTLFGWNLSSATSQTCKTKFPMEFFSLTSFGMNSHYLAFLVFIVLQIRNVSVRCGFYVHSMDTRFWPWYYVFAEQADGTFSMVRAVGQVKIFLER